MSKLWVILQREYWSRVKKKSFLLLAILGPFILATVTVCVGYLDGLSNGNQYILIVDETGGLMKGIKSTPAIRYEYTNQPIGEIKSYLTSSSYTAALWIPSNILASKAPKLFYKVRPNYRIIKGLERNLEERIELERAKANNLSIEQYRKVKMDINLNSFYIDNIGREFESDALGFFVSLILGSLIYAFIFVYGVQVMRGVKEERVNKIIEILLSSVKPGQILSGKILGICLVSLTQLAIWALLTFGLVQIGKIWLLDYYQNGLNLGAMSTSLLEQLQQSGVSLNPTTLYRDMTRIEFGLILPVFFIFLVLGYLLYSSLFAISATLSDPDTDEQQFVLPVTLPLVLALFSGVYLAFVPDAAFGKFAAVFPLTSPVVMLVKISMNTATIAELITSITVLIITILLTIWVAGKIYKGGVLFRGTKPNWRTIKTWIIRRS